MAGRGAPKRDAAATPPPAAAAANGQILRQQQTPPTAIRRHLPFASMKPPFIPADDYHRFSTPARAAAAAADHPPEAIIVKSPVGSEFSLYYVLQLCFCPWFPCFINLRECNYFCYLLDGLLLNLPLFNISN